jgi:hypothetical protein
MKYGKKMILQCHFQELTFKNQLALEVNFHPKCLYLAQDARWRECERPIVGQAILEYSFEKNPKYRRSAQKRRRRRRTRKCATEMHREGQCTVIRNNRE